MSVEDDKYQRLGEWLHKHEWDMKSYSLGSEVKELLKNVVDNDTEIKGYLDLLSGSICLCPIVDGEMFMIRIQSLGKFNKENKGGEDYA